MRPFRFGVNLLFAGDRESWAARCRRAEALGYDVIAVPDHLASPAPFPSAVAAADATTRCRVGTFVIKGPLWNPAVLRREVLTAERLTGGRFELGIGVGRDRADFDAAGLAWPRPADRLRHVEQIVRDLIGGESADPRPGPPVLLAGNGDRILDLAARHADAVGFRPVGRAKADPPGTTRLLDAAALAERTGYLRARVAERAVPLELNLLLRSVIPTAHRRAEAERLHERFSELEPDALLETPALLIGTVPEMAGQLRERRERFGFSYLVVQEPSMEALAPVIEALAGA